MSKYDVQNLKVILGDHDLKKSDETRATIAEHRVKRVVRHKKFDATSLVNHSMLLMKSISTLATVYYSATTYI